MKKVFPLDWYATDKNKPEPISEDKSFFVNQDEIKNNSDSKYSKDNENIDQRTNDSIANSQTISLSYFSIDKQ